MKKDICQFYHYDHNDVNIDYNNPKFFADNFNDKFINNNKSNWLNFHSTEDVENILKLCSNFNIDVIAVEDIFKDIKPKLEEYNKYIFFTLKSGLSEENTFNLKKDKITFILSENFLISFQNKSSDHFREVRDRIDNKKGRIRNKGCDYLLYRMIMAILDNYFEVLNDISNDITNIENKINKSPENNDLVNIEKQKRKLIELKKIVTPIRDITLHIQKIDKDIIKTENVKYFHELYDNCVNILNEIDDNKQILDGLSNLYYAIQGQKMNEIMKLLTIMSTIFIPLTFIAGIYGMNFENMPELKTKNGYYVAWGVMLIISISLIIYFVKRGWFKNS